MKEIWKEASVDGYFVSNFGRLKGRSGKILKLFKSKTNQYLKVCIRIEGRNSKCKCLKIHREVAKAFIPNPNNLPQINHIDGNKENNSVTNLEWCTDKENTIHAFKLGLSKPIKGSKNVQSKITTEQVKWIREHYIPRDSKFGCRALARQFDMSHKAVSKLIRKLSYTTD